MLTYAAIAARYRPRYLVWENVPGVLSSNRGRDFASFLGLLTGQSVGVPAGGWQNSGMLSGIADAYGVAWRIDDAQYAGVPQRRRRVFVVGHLGDWRRAAAVLLISEGLRGDPPTRREKGQGVTGSLAARTRGGGGLGTDFDTGGGSSVAKGEGYVHCPDIVPQAMSSKWAKGTSGPAGDEVANLVAHGAHTTGAGFWKEGVGTLRGRAQESHEHLVTHSLRADGFDASEDGSGRGTPLVPIAIQERAICENPDAGPDGVGVRTDGQAYTVEARSVPQAVAFQQNSRSEGRFIGGDGAVVGAISAEQGAQQQNYIAFSAKDHGADAGETSPTLRSMGHDGSHANGGGQVAIAFNIHPTGGQGAALEATETDLSTAISPVTHGKTTDRGTRIVTGVPMQETAPTLDQRAGRSGETSFATSGGLIPVAFESRFARNGRGAPSDVVPPLKAESGKSGKGDGAPLVMAPTLTSANDPSRSPQSSEITAQVGAVHATTMQVRRITPTEASRLQGFPDDYLDIQFRGKPAADGPKYKALGNSFAVPCVSWIGRRIQLVSDLS